MRCVCSASELTLFSFMNWSYCCVLAESISLSGTRFICLRPVSATDEQETIANAASSPARTPQAYPRTRFDMTEPLPFATAGTDCSAEWEGGYRRTAAETTGGRFPSVAADDPACRSARRSTTIRSDLPIPL